ILAALCDSPAALGFAMPAEWEPHEATWIAWPHNPTDWPDKLDTIRWVYTEIVRRIGAGEIVRVLVNSRDDARRAVRCLNRWGVSAAGVEFLVHPTNRGWTRDSGPVFVRRGIPNGAPAIVRAHVPRGRTRVARSGDAAGGSARATGETAVVHFHFNAWAKYSNW